ncbi:biotin/lipoyl-binding protein [Halarcobacter anaerophilus]|uniref:biotin/lipoyl-binding protein n=1 Tax=Halarcobacter anaerophilus TaxID=877500 RepID=UPI0005C9AFD2|nr:biotin/lipoyl-binding protein [Halarcobacter anaerophilus]
MKKSYLFILPIVALLFLSGCFKEDEKTQFYGNVDLRTVSLGFRVSGKIKNIYFDEGQTLKKGDTIAKLEDDLYTQSLKSIQAQIKMQKLK